MKWLAIINPVSGQNTHPTRLRKLLADLRPVVAACEFTRYSGHAHELACAASDFDGIAVAGGDGTLYEVVSGMDLTRQVLAVIPAGTGNSLARDLHLRTCADGIAALRGLALERIKSMRRIDLMRITFTTRHGVTHQRYAATTIGLGYPAHVTQTGNRRCKRLGRWCYPAAATLEAFAPQAMSAHIGYHGEVSAWKELTGVLINNTQHSGNFRAFPHANLEDGRLDVMEMQAGWFGQTLHNLAVLTHIDSYAPSRISQTAAIVIDLKNPQALMIDGEIIPDAISLHVRSIPEAVACCRNGG